MERFAINILHKQIYKICRLCGVDNPVKFPIIDESETIIVGDDDEATLARKIEECVGIQVTKEDKMPQNICSLCVDKINDFYEYRLMCAATNLQTRTILNLPLVDPTRKMVTFADSPKLEVKEEEKDVKKVVESAAPGASSKGSESTASSSTGASDTVLTISLGRKGKKRRSLPSPPPSPAPTTRVKAAAEIVKDEPVPNTPVKALTKKERLKQLQIQKEKEEKEKVEKERLKEEERKKAEEEREKRKRGTEKEKERDKRKAEEEKEKKRKEDEKDKKRREKEEEKDKKKKEDDKDKKKKEDEKRKKDKEDEKPLRSKRKEPDPSPVRESEKAPAKVEPQVPPPKKIKFEHPCSYCSDEFKTETELESHLVSKHTPSVRKFGCGSCRETFETVLESKDHNLWHQLTRTLYTCFKCKRKYDKNLALVKHMTLNACGRISRGRPPTILPDVQCRLCNKKFKTQNLYEWHSCFLKPKAKCPKCNKYFVKKQILTRHYMMYCTGNLPPPEPVIIPKEEPIDPSDKTAAEKAERRTRRSVHVEPELPKEEREIPFPPPLELEPEPVKESTPAPGTAATAQSPAAAVGKRGKHARKEVVIEEAPAAKATEKAEKHEKPEKSEKPEKRVSFAKTIVTDKRSIVAERKAASAALKSAAAAAPVASAIKGSASKLVASGKAASALKGSATAKSAPSSTVEAEKIASLLDSGAKVDKDTDITTINNLLSSVSEAIASISEAKAKKKKRRKDKIKEREQKDEETSAVDDATGGSPPAKALVPEETAPTKQKEKSKETPPETMSEESIPDSVATPVDNRTEEERQADALAHEVGEMTLSQQLAFCSDKLPMVVLSKTTFKEECTEIDMEPSRLQEPLDDDADVHEAVENGEANEEYEDAANDYSGFQDDDEDDEEQEEQLPPAPEKVAQKGPTPAPEADEEENEEDVEEPSFPRPIKLEPGVETAEETPEQVPEEDLASLTRQEAPQSTRAPVKGKNSVAPPAFDEQLALNIKREPGLEEGLEQPPAKRKRPDSRSSIASASSLSSTTSAAQSSPKPSLILKIKKEKGVHNASVPPAKEIRTIVIDDDDDDEDQDNVAQSKSHTSSVRIKQEKIDPAYDRHEEGSQMDAELPAGIRIKQEPLDGEEPQKRSQVDESTSAPSPKKRRTVAAHSSVPPAPVVAFDGLQIKQEKPDAPSPLVQSPTPAAAVQAAEVPRSSEKKKKSKVKINPFALLKQRMAAEAAAKNASAATPDTRTPPPAPQAPSPLPVITNVVSNAASSTPSPSNCSSGGATPVQEAEPVLENTRAVPVISQVTSIAAAMPSSEPNPVRSSSKNTALPMPIKEEPLDEPATATEEQHVEEQQQQEIEQEEQETLRHDDHVAVAAETEQPNPEPAAEQEDTEEEQDEFPQPIKEEPSEAVSAGSQESTQLHKLPVNNEAEAEEEVKSLNDTGDAVGVENAPEDGDREEQKVPQESGETDETSGGVDDSRVNGEDRGELEQAKFDETAESASPNIEKDKCENDEIREINEAAEVVSEEDVCEDKVDNSEENKDKGEDAEDKEEDKEENDEAEGEKCEDEEDKSNDEEEKCEDDEEKCVDEEDRCQEERVEEEENKCEQQQEEEDKREEEQHEETKLEDEQSKCESDKGEAQSSEEEPRAIETKEEMYDNVVDDETTEGKHSGGNSKTALGEAEELLKTVLNDKPVEEDPTPVCVKEGQVSDSSESENIQQRLQDVVAMEPPDVEQRVQPDSGSHVQSTEGEQPEERQKEGINQQTEVLESLPLREDVDCLDGQMLAKAGEDTIPLINPEDSTSPISDVPMDEYDQNSQGQEAAICEPAFSNSNVEQPQAGCIESNPEADVVPPVEASKLVGVAIESPGAPVETPLANEFLSVNEKSQAYADNYPSSSASQNLVSGQQPPGFQAGFETPNYSQASFHSEPTCYVPPALVHSHQNNLVPGEGPILPVQQHTLPAQNPACQTEFDELQNLLTEGLKPPVVLSYTQQPLPEGTGSLVRTDMDSISESSNVAVSSNAGVHGLEDELDSLLNNKLEEFSDQFNKTGVVPVAATVGTQDDINMAIERELLHEMMPVPVPVPQSAELHQMPNSSSSSNNSNNNLLDIGNPGQS